MKSSKPFYHFPNRPEKLTPKFIEAEYAKLISKIESVENSSSSEAWEKLFWSWDELSSYVNSECSRIRYRFSGNLSDKDLEATDTFVREKITPVWENAESAMLIAFMNSKHREALTKSLSPQLFHVLETKLKPLDPRLADLRIEQARLQNDYRKLIGTAEVEFRGEKVTLPKLGSYAVSPSADLRRESFLISRDWFLKNRMTITKIFDDLVQVRQKMAETIGEKNYLGLGYMGMGRTDYGVNESASFRKFVKDYVVPLQNKIHAEQAKALGTQTLKPWDVAYHPELVLPMGISPIEKQLDCAQKVFNRISPKLAGHFSEMRKDNRIDLENRPGKTAGAFSDERKAAVLCNSTGNAQDVTILMHEMGHAFQGTESMLQDHRPQDLVWPTMDAAEIHSMGMEYLSMSHMDVFFDKDEAERLRKGRWKSAIHMMCYVAVVDEFQHWVYENPNASIDDRDQKWNELTQIYQPSQDYRGYENLGPTRWYGQGHIFAMPFYYIDYAIAETGAMQLAVMNEADPKKAVEVYLELCRIGGSKSVLNIFKGVGLASPFSADSMKNLMAYAEKQLELTS
jgi:M3 family oligoendopeptidase